MKILYIANERRSAVLAVTALRRIAPDVAITWAGHLSVAMRWVLENRDLAAIVVEAEVQNQNCTSFVSEVRRLGLTAPVIVVASEEVGAPLAALEAGADDYVASQSLLADMPDTVGRALQRAQATASAASEPRRSLYKQESEAHRLAKTARTERQSLERQLASARAHSESVEQEEHLQTEAEVKAADREHLERQVRAALASASESERRFNTAADFLRESKTLLRAVIDQEKTKRDILAQNLADAETALKEAERRQASEMTTAAAELAAREAQHETEMAQSAAARETLAQQVRDAGGALEQARQAWAAGAAAAAERLIRRETELAATIAEATATRDTLELRLADAAAALEHAEQRASADQLAAAHALQRQNEVEGRLAHEVANRDILAQKLADAETALKEAERRQASEMTTAAAQLAARQSRHDAEMSQSAAARETLAQQVRDAEGALEQARQAWAAGAAAAAERLIRREAELAATLAEATATRDTLELRLADAAAALQHAEQRASADQLAAAHALQRQNEVEARLAQEGANRDILAHDLADTQTALKEAERRQASEMTTAAAELAAREAQHETEMAQSAAARETLAQQVRDAEGALEQARQAWAAGAAAAAERFTRREAELAATIAEAIATRDTLELRLADAVAALQHAEQRASADQLAAAHALQRQGEVEVRLAREVVNRESIERDLADARVAGEHAQRCFVDEAAAVSRRTREHEALFEERFARERVDHEIIRAEMQEEIRHLRLERDTLHQSLDTSQEQLQGLTSASDAAREHFERARMTSEAERQRLAAEHAGAQQRLEQVRMDLEQTLERVSSEHAAERARLETLVIERDTRLEQQAVSHSASQHAASNALTQIEDELRLALEASGRDRREIEQLQGALEARGQELEATRSDREVLRTQADRVPQLQNQLDDSWAENRRQFEQTPYGICRVGRDGALKHVNHALVALLRYRTSDELRTVDFATRIFESGDDLRLLIERCVSKGTLESVEATWRRKDKSRLVVRLFALPAASESIEIVVEDITDLRALGEKLRQVQPMEAMARLATEVAGTCDNVLRGVSHDARQWLATIDRDTALRHEGERLLHEVTRAAGFLRQLGAYGNKQMTALEPIDVNRVLRDLEPVLKRVAGDDIELVMPKTSSPVNVAVEAERIERVLVNVASFGRERMPFGGRLRIELATVVVGPKFVAKYPNVRTGDHVLITVTEMTGGFRSDSPIRPPRKPAGANTMRSVSDRPGVDLGVLQGLIRDCGGHLWIKAEPTGDMVLKVRLPQPLLDDSIEPPTGSPRSDRGRSMSRWFRH